MSPVTVATAVSPFGAEIVRGRLSDAEIWAEVIGANHITADWLVSTALGGVKVRVAPEDEVQARALLAEPADLDDAEPLTSAERWSWTAFTAAGLVFIFPLLLLVSTYAIGKTIATADHEASRTWRRIGWSLILMSPGLVLGWLLLR